MPSQHLIDHGRKLDSINVFVGNLSLDMTETQLKQEFVPYGEILSTSIMNDRYIGSNQQRGYGYVWMAVRKEGEAAIVGLNGKMFQNHVVNVLEALPLSHAASDAPARSKFRQRD
jgi:RNA recognition motif-containing protein